MTIQTLNQAFHDQMMSELDAGNGGNSASKARDAFSRFSRWGLPTKRSESWRYTDLSRFIAQVHPPLEGAPAQALPADKLGHINSDITLVIDHGFFRADVSSSLSDMASFGVRIGSRTDHMAGFNDNWLDEDSLIDLNQVMTNDMRNIRLMIDRGDSFKLRLRHIMGAVGPASVYNRLAIDVADGGEVEIIETFEAVDTCYFANMASSLTLGEAAKVSHSWIGTPNGGAESALVSSYAASLGPQSKLDFHPMIMTPHMSRLQVAVDFMGEYGDFTLNGLAMLSHEQQGDLTLGVRHRAPNCTSREHYKLVLNDRATGVFQGKVIVDRGAQKTEGEMMARALLLGDHARFRGKPELEIFADDVVCGHGATSAALDPAEVYYLRSRGIGEVEARALLTEAFLADIISELPNEALSDYVLGLFQARAC